MWVCKWDQYCIKPKLWSSQSKSRFVWDNFRGVGLLSCSGHRNCWQPRENFVSQQTAQDQHLAWIRQSWRLPTGNELMGEVLMKQRVRQLVPRDKSYTDCSLIRSSPTLSSLDSPESRQSKQMGKNTISCRATRNPNNIPSQVLGQHANLSSSCCYWKWPGVLTRQ